MSSDTSMLVEILAVIAFSTLFSLGGGNGQLAIIQDHWVDPGLRVRRFSPGHTRSETLSRGRSVASLRVSVTFWRDSPAP